MDLFSVISLVKPSLLRVTHGLFYSWITQRAKRPWLDPSTKQELSDYVGTHHVAGWNVPQHWEKWLLQALSISLLQARFLSHISPSLSGEEHRSQSLGNSTQRCDSVGVPWPTGMGKVTSAIPVAACLFPRASHLCCCILTLSLEEPEWPENPRGNNHQWANRTSSTTWFIPWLWPFRISSLWIYPIPVISNTHPL